jgi:hypothetical protein
MEPNDMSVYSVCDCLSTGLDATAAAAAAVVVVDDDDDDDNDDEV